jgi:hypothetical protein
MNHFVRTLFHALRVFAFLALLSLVGVLAAKAKGVSPEHLATVVAIPIISMVLVFKVISAMPELSAEEAEGVWKDFNGKPSWLQKATIICSLDVLFTAVTAICAGLYGLLGLKHEFVASYSLGAVGLVLFFLLMISMPILHVVVKSETFREISMQAVLGFAFLLTVSGPAEIMSGRFPTLDRCHNKV